MSFSPWHKACKAIWRAVFILAEMGDKTGKDVLSVVAGCGDKDGEDKGGVWEEALVKMSEKQWKEPESVMSPAAWEARGHACSL